MRRLLVALASVTLLAAACGGSDTTPTTRVPAGGTSPSTTLAATTTEAVTTSPPDVEAPELAGTDWIVTDYRLPSGTLTNVWKTDVTISFGADGTVSGSAGCNDYQGTWSVSGAWNEFEEGVPDPEDGQGLTLSDLSWTERACEDPDIMQQESEILDLLQDAGRWVLIRGNFHLRDGEGSFLFEAEPA